MAVRDAKRSIRGTAAVAVLGLVAALAASGAGAAGQADPPRIVPWHQIGNVGLGMTKQRVTYTYGKPLARGNHLVWRVAGGTLSADFNNAVSSSATVSAVQTTSARYRTPGGVGVGTRIPLGRCHHTSSSDCVHLWQGFTYARGAWSRSFAYGKRTVDVYLDVRNGAVTFVTLRFVDY